MAVPYPTETGGDPELGGEARLRRGRFTLLTASTTRWGLRKLASADDIRLLSAEVNRSFPVNYIDHDIAWSTVKRAHPDEGVLVLVDQDEGGLHGVAPFQFHPAHLVYAIGPARLFRKQTSYIQMEYEPITTRPDRRKAVSECYGVLAGVMPDKSVVYCEFVPTDSDLYALLDDKHSPLHEIFHVLPWGPETVRFKIRWNGSYETYLASLGKISRKDLRRTMKKFDAEFGGRAELRRYQSPASVKAYLRDAIPVSDKTYQKQKLGIGLSDYPPLESELTYAAEQGYFLGHTLNIDGRAVAFHHGFVYRGTFFMIDGGYDPDFAKCQIGVVIFCEMLKDIEQHKDPISVMDYMNGQSVFKERTSNTEEKGRAFLLFRKTATGFVSYATLKYTNKVSNVLTRLVQGIEVEHHIRDFVRKKTGRGHI